MMRLLLSVFLVICVAFSYCTEPISPGPTSVVQVSPVDTTDMQIDSCENRLLNLQTLIGCPEFVGGYVNGISFSGTADAGLRTNLGPDYSIVTLRSFDEVIGYATELGLTFNGNPELNRFYPLTTNGDDLDTWHSVASDSVYLFLVVWLDESDLNPPIAYKYSSGFTNWIRVDSSSYTIFEGEPVTDHFGALEATLVLNQTEYIQDNVQYYLDRGFCVPDTIFLRDVCFDARTRDVDGPCRRKAGR